MDLKLDMSKVDKLAEDLQKLEIPKVIKGDKDSAVPMFQSKGYLEKLGTKKKQWYKRFFVLRDSFLLSYNLAKSDFTVEPNKCIHLVKCKFEVVEYPGKEHCFSITTQDKDTFLFAAASDKERDAWRKDIEISRIVSHKNMVKLAVENQCLAEAKGITDVVKNFSGSALSIFANPDYIRRTPVTGGAEGWLRTPGFCAASKGAKHLKKHYLMLKDSHLLMFQGGDVLKKPRGAMYLVGTVCEETEEVDGLFKFLCKSNHCADFVELFASSETQRQRWMTALKVGARVTYGDFKLLLKEHEILSNYQADAAAAIEPPVEDESPIQKLDLEDAGIQGDELEPGTSQPYDEHGNPLVRNPEGRLVDAQGSEVTAKTARFGQHGQQLDSFNRVLPSGAVPMFTQDGTPIGVGPDGNHYLPDGTVIEASAPHYDLAGNQLDQATVDAANAVAEKVNVAIKVRARMKPEGAGVEEVDVLGRTFRPSKDKKAASDTMINADGQAVPVATARRVVTADGDLVQHDPATREKQTGRLVIKADHEGDETELGAVEIDETSTISDVRAMIDKEVNTDFPDFVFLVNSIPLTKVEELDKMAMACLPEIVIRGIELKPVNTNGRQFSAKVDSLLTYEEQKRKEAQEFSDIMSRIRTGNFLRKTRALEDEP